MNSRRVSGRTGSRTWRGSDVRVRFGCRETGLYLGYPVIAGSDRLPQGGVRPTGIEPDVVIRSAERDPIGRIIEYYETRR